MQPQRGMILRLEISMFVIEMMMLVELVYILCVAKPPAYDDDDDMILCMYVCHHEGG